MKNTVRGLELLTVPVADQFDYTGGRLIIDKFNRHYFTAVCQDNFPSNYFT